MLERIAKAQKLAAEAIARHGGRAALSFSGGRDSLAVLYLLRDYWEYLGVYHCATGDSFPEIEKIVAETAAQVPLFILVQGRVREVWQTLGWPTDLVPVNSTPMGRIRYGAERPQLVDRMVCCLRSYMEPIYNAMVGDGNTLVIRGTRSADNAVQPTESGDVLDGIEFLYPIADWSDDEVMDYLASVGVKPAPFYERGLKSSLDCMHCTGWWELQQGAYLKSHHPEAYTEWERRMGAIKSAIAAQIEPME
ncbi:phosphoadenosine phosphosulfate reductase family protein [Dechloromonas agitata]|uniref:phosphoadenosine phosphosulfate reductase family protein n=1 Tax=Dechloromonas agitata TaxID=73030 RepID=UPI00237EBB34|nr:phosphoadenosine phosphosulfate reductase family protein [Dechloromonas agitata]MDE1545917.1 phosphoadenosine phosphosulfate reductase family protein [Dechloromonas agitata]